jgi:hypothetical protein
VFCVGEEFQLLRLLTTTQLTECCKDRRELLQRGGRSFLKEEKRLKRKRAGGESEMITSDEKLSPAEMLERLYEFRI